MAVDAEEQLELRWEKEPEVSLTNLIGVQVRRAKA